MRGFDLAFGVVAPLVIYMAVGALIKRLGLFSEGTLKEMNNVIFKVLIPLSLFFDICGADLGSTVQAPLFIWVAVLLTAAFIISLALSKRFIPDRADVPTVSQGIFRSNYVLFGTVISASIAGDEGAAITAALAVLVVPLFNVLAILNFELLRGGRVDAKRVCLQIIKNPLVIGSAAGVIFNVLGLQLPEVVYGPLNTLGDLASPLALVVLGAMLSYRSIASHKGRLLAAVIGKLVAVPVICMTVMALLGYRNGALAALLSVFASPTAVASTPMAQALGGNVRLAGEIVALTTAGSVVTIFLFTAALSYMGLI